MTFPTDSPPPDEPRGGVDLDVGPRHSGKTRRAIAWLAADPDSRLLVVATVVERDHARVVARLDWPGVRWSPRHVLTPGQARALLTDPRSPRDVAVWVDDADRVLSRLLGGVRLDGVCWTGPTPGASGARGELRRERAVDTP